MSIRAKSSAAPLPKKLMTVKEVAERFAVRRETVRRWLREGKLPHEVYPGRRLLVPAEAVEAQIAKGAGR
jgi:excisionase family DNA binding protein